ncbi:MAG: laminin G domain-containing protein, partial [Sedimentisphaerales bacterium]|nr:laminin G domain-containing protein [Sedimentisphaerales bacterium]
DPSIISRGISINNNNLDEEGTVLAMIAEVSADTGPVGGMVIAELPAGATLQNSSGSPDDVLGGPRLVFLTGSREPDGVTGGQAAALYDLYPDGEKMFLNAVKYMIPVIPVNPGTDGLTAHYAFENDLADSSGNGLDGTAIGDPTFAAGVEGMALDLNGDDYVDCGGVAEFSFADAMTVSTWVNVRSHTAAWMAMVAKGENAWRLGFNNTTTGVHYAFSGGGRGWQAANTATELAFGEWYHVAATYDTNVGATVYINGKADASNPDTGGIDINQFSMLIGENPEATGRLFDGMLDEIMLYDKALSESEILYLAGFRVPIKPVHSYTFEDGTGNDSVGDADGVLVGDAAIVDGSLVVDGDGDWMEMPGDVIAINTYSEMTLELWSTQSVDNPFSMTASFGGTWDNGMGKDYIFIATGRGDQMNRGAIANTPDEVNPWEDEVGVSSPELNDGIEHHYVLTITAEELAYYVDGVLIGTAPMGDTTTISGVSNDFVFLGKGIYSVDPTMNCSVNEFNIYDVALSTEQIAASFAEGPIE